jgi:hypothetical protein
LVERWLRRQHIGSVTYEFTASPRELPMKPSDVRIVNLDGELLRGRLTRMVYKADRSIETEWERDGATRVDGTTATTGDPAALTTSPGATALGRPPPVVFNPTPARAFVLDIPLVSDADDQTTPFAYLTAGRETADGTFPGAEIQQSDTGADGTWTEGWDAVASSDEAIWGDCQTTLGDALPWIPDRENVLVVNIPVGTLESETDAYLNANPTANLAAVGSHAGGWELVQFGEAVIVSEGVWHLSNFYRRGVKGTERFISTHGPDELFVLLSRLTKHDLGAGEVGDTDYYRAVTTALDAEDADQISVEFEAQAHRPLSPVHIALSRDAGSGDWSGTFVRRSRIGGGTVNGQDVPLGEASEAYRMKVMDGVTVMRTINVATPAFTYTNAQQVADFGSPQLTLEVQICQMDPTLNIEGAAATAGA